MGKLSSPYALIPTPAYKNKCPDIGHALKSVLLILFRQGDEKNVREFYE